MSSTTTLKSCFCSKFKRYKAETYYLALKFCSKYMLESRKTDIIEELNRAPVNGFTPQMTLEIGLNHNVAEWVTKGFIDSVFSPLEELSTIAWLQVLPIVPDQVHRTRERIHHNRINLLKSPPSDLNYDRNTCPYHGFSDHLIHCVAKAVIDYCQHLAPLMMKAKKQLTGANVVARYGSSAQELSPCYHLWMLTELSQYGGLSAVMEEEGRILIEGLEVVRKYQPLTFTPWEETHIFGIDEQEKADAEALANARAAAEAQAAAASAAAAAASANAGAGS